MNVSQVEYEVLGAGVTLDEFLDPPKRPVTFPDDLRRRAGETNSEWKLRRQAAEAAALSSRVATQDLENRERVAQSDRRFQEQQASKIVTTYAISGLAGFLVGGTALALLWKSHRVWGFILGSAVIGAPVGYMVGTAIVAAKFRG